MKHLFALIGITLLMVSQFGCSGDPNNSYDTPLSVSVDDVNPNEVPYSGTLFIGDASEKFGTDEYTLNTAVIEGDTLRVNVSYGGGCEKHHFTLIASEPFLESFPIQCQVSLAHHANGDACEAWLTEDYHFDLTPIRTLYQKAHQQKAGSIILRLKDAPNVELVYELENIE